MNTYDIAIVGNGILGCATALELIRSDRNPSVALIGPSQRPGAASSAAGAMISCCAEVNHRTLSSVTGKAKLEISLRALQAWPAWLDGLNQELPAERRLAIRNGTFVILNSKGGRLDNLNYQAILDAARCYGQTLEDVPLAEVPGLNPSGDARPIQAVYLPDEGSIDARSVLDAIVSVAGRNGVTFIDGDVVGWQQDGGRATCAVTRSGELIHADRFLVAAGSRSHSVLMELADESAPLPPVMAGKGLAVTGRDNATGLRHVVRTPNRAGGCGLHMVPLADGMVYLGATNDLRLQPDETTTIGIAHFLITCAIEQLDNRFFQSEIVQWHKGNRPASFDGYPLIGRVWQDNVWLLSGTYRDGFHCSPVLARHTADTMLGGPGILGDHCFDALRKPLRTMSVEEATDEIVLHTVSQFYEHSAKPPVYMGITSGLERQVRSRTRATYDLLQTDLGLGPELLELLNWGENREQNIKYFREYLKRASYPGSTDRF